MLRNLFMVCCFAGCIVAEKTNEENREKRGSIGGHGGSYAGGANFLVVGGSGSDGHGPSAADIASQAAAQASAAAAGLHHAGNVAAARTASRVAAVAAAASQTAQAAAYQKRAQAVQITKAAQGAQAAALQESTLAAVSAEAEKASDIAAALSKGLFSSLSQLSGEANALAKHAGGSFDAAQGFLNSQNSMAWQTQQAANALRHQQILSLHELQSAVHAASQASVAAGKARAKAKGASFGGLYGFGGSIGYH